METQISNLTVVELKALAYDQLAQIELCQQNLRLINQELAKKFQPQPQPDPTKSTISYDPLPIGSIQTV